jgi:hypothetical protein
MERLHKEQDIAEIIRMNRITKILHKIALKPPQRRTVNFFKNRTITDTDVPIENRQQAAS